MDVRPSPEPTHEIRFQSLSLGAGLCFPCDEQGRVEMDALSDRARENYLYARAVVGVEFAHPTVCPTLATASRGHGPIALSSAPRASCR